MLAFRRGVPLFLLFLSFCAESSAKMKPWIEVRSPHFRVLSDGGSGNARRVAREFEQMRTVFAVGFPNMRLDTGAPLLIFAPRDEYSMKSLAPAVLKKEAAHVAGFFVNGWERQFAVVRLDQDVPGAYQVVYHEYIHSLLHANLRWLPLWLDEGLAEYYGATRFEDKKVYVGAPPARVLRIQNQVLIPLEKLITENPYVAYRGDDKRIDRFYGESWALVHYFVFGEGMGKGKKISEFYTKIQLGEEQKKAFTEVFGNFDEVQNGLDQYVRKFAFTSYVMSTPQQTDEKEYAVRNLSVAETEAAIGGFRLWMHDTAEAQEITEAGLQDDPQLAELHENMGFLDFAEGKDAEALKEFSTAYEMDKQRYLSLYFKTMMSPFAWSDAPADIETLHAGLAQVIKINPDFAETFARLSFMQVRAGNLPSALAVARKAEELEPSRAGYHLLSGKILLRMGKGADAAAAASFVAGRWHGPDHNEAVELWNAVPANERSLGESWDTEDNAGETAQGIVKAVACGDATHPYALTLESEGKTLVFRGHGGYIIGYSDTLWYGSDHFSACHHIEGLRAVVRYKPGDDKAFTGDLTSLELREDLPPGPRSSQKPAQPPTKSAVN